MVQHDVVGRQDADDAPTGVRHHSHQQLGQRGSGHLGDEFAPEAEPQLRALPHQAVLQDWDCDGRMVFSPLLCERLQEGCGENGVFFIF